MRTMIVKPRPDLIAQDVALDEGLDWRKRGVRKLPGVFWPRRGGGVCASLASQSSGSSSSTLLPGSVLTDG